MVYQNYMNVISEFYDLTDPKIRDKVLFCNEAEKSTVIEQLASKLYSHIVNKVDEIDFGTIPLSKGDITKIENYDNLIDCLNIIHDMVIEYHQSTALVDEIYTAIDNIKRRTKMFTKAFALGIEFPMITYNVTVTGIVAGVSLLINTCIEYVKNPDASITTAFDKSKYSKSKDHVLFNSIRLFNQSCTKADFDKLMDETIKRNLVVAEADFYGELNSDKSINEDAFALVSDLGSSGSGFLLILIGLAAAPVIIKTLLWGLRSICYWIFHMRQTIAEYYTDQANFLEVNAENLQYREKYKDNEEERKKIYQKQMNWVARFRRWANFFMVKDNKAQKQTREDEKNDDRTNNGDGSIF